MDAYQKVKRKDKTYYDKTKTTSVVFTNRLPDSDDPIIPQSQFTCKYVALANLALTGTQAVDGESPDNGDKILVANNTDASENGIYTYDDTDDWLIDPTISGGALISVTGGTKQGTLWIVETPLFLVGTDDISIVQIALSRKENDYNSFPALTIADDDAMLAEDADDSYKKKKFTFSALKTFFNFLSKAAGEFASFSSATPTTSDKMLIEDESDSGAKKVITLSDLLALVPSGLPTGTTDLALVSWDASTSAYVERAKVRVDSNGKLLLSRTTGTGPTLDITQTVNGTVIVVDNSGLNNYMELKSSGAAAYTFGKSAFLVYHDTYLQNQKSLIFKELATNGANFVAIKAPASLAGDTTYTLPSTDGTSGQVLSTNGSGVLSWINN